jgi:hypothetical protein
VRFEERATFAKHLRVRVRRETLALLLRVSDVANASDSREGKANDPAEPNTYEGTETKRNHSGRPRHRAAVYTEPSRAKPACKAPKSRILTFGGVG